MHIYLESIGLSAPKILLSQEIFIFLFFFTKNKRHKKIAEDHIKPLVIKCGYSTCVFKCFLEVCLSFKTEEA